MRILVTGGAGFIGSWIAHALMVRGNDVHVVDDLSGGSKNNVSPRCKFKQLDLTKAKKVEAYFRTVKPDIVHHLACWPYEGLSQFLPLQVSQSVYTASLNVFASAVRNNVKRVINWSSMARFGHGNGKLPFDESLLRQPVDIYGASKVAAEVALEALSEACGLEYVTLVPHNISGPRMRLDDPYRGVLGIWINCLMRNKPFIIYGDGSHIRAFSHIEDIIEPVITATFSDKVKNEVINLGSAKIHTLNETAEILLEEFGSDLKPVHMPDRPCEVADAYCSTKKSEELLGFKDKRTLRDIFRDTIVYAKNVGPQKPRYLQKLEIEKGAPETWLKKLI